MPGGVAVAGEFVLAVVKNDPIGATVAVFVGVVVEEILHGALRVRAETCS